MPSEAEVDAAAKAIYEHRCREISGQFAPFDELLKARAYYLEAARAALAAAEYLASLPKGFREWNDQIDAIEAKTIERCAKVADERTTSRGEGYYSIGASDMAHEIAAAIRALRKTDAAEKTK